MSTPKICIATTLRNAGPVVDSFLDYHFKIGVDHTFLFFDDPEDVSIQSVSSRSNVTVFRNNDELKRLWSCTNIYNETPALRSYAPLEVMARQVLNLEVAMQAAMEAGYQWIIHLDIDELLHFKNVSLKDHFEKLDRKKINLVRYSNYEAVPERFDVDDFFVECTMFKKNPLELGFWQSRFVKKNKPSKDFNYFLYYACGKSAAPLTPSLRSAGVHSFTHKGVKTREHNTQEAVVLHYPICGFNHFWSKYETLGAFADNWFGTESIRTRVPFHLAARDVVNAGDKEIAREFFKEYVMMENSLFLERCLAKKIFTRIHEPQRILKANSFSPMAS